jgi:hypothetical protein
MGPGLNKSIIGCLLIFLLSISLDASEKIKSIQLTEQPSQINLVDKSDNSVTLEVSIGQIDFIDVHTRRGDFALPLVDNFSRSFQIGEPALPVVNRLLSVPFGCRLEIEIISTDYEQYSLGDYGIELPLIPVQPSLSKSDDPLAVPFEHRQDIYQEDEFYSLPLVEASMVGVMRSVRVGMVSLAPVEYNPVTGQLRVCKNMTARVNFVDPDLDYTQTMAEKYYSPYFEPIYKRLLNYDDNITESRQDITRYPVKYVIVSDRIFESQLQPFIEWKTMKGFNVITAYTDDIGYTSNDIKNYIEDLYDAATTEDPAPSFVLFVGDDDLIPAFTGYQGSHITDLRFCEYTGDYLPEIYYGRFSALTVDDLQPQIDKTLEYEKYLIPDPGYLAEVTLVAGVDASFADPYCNGQMNYGTANYFNAAHGITPHVWLYPESDYPSATQTIIESVNDGIGFYNYSAHCNHDGPSNPMFKVNDIADLTNYHKYLLGIANCCDANSFGDNHTTPCFGEAFLRAEDKGGIGFIGATNDTYWDEDYYWGVGYGPIDGDGPAYEETGPGAYDGMFHDHGEPASQHYDVNSAIMMAGNLAVNESGSNYDNYYWEVYHLMGDPSVSTYLGLPAPNNVSHPAEIMIYETTIDVQADPGSYIGISKDGVLHGVALVDESGSATVALIPFAESGLADMVVTAPNKVPYISTVMVNPETGAQVVYDMSTIDDYSGNNNGLVDAGETILLGVQVVNIGPDNASDVNAVITTSDEFVTVTDASQYYGTMAGEGGTMYFADAFEFEVSPDAPDGHQIAFYLIVDGTVQGGARTDDPPWFSQFGIIVHAPQLIYFSYSIDDYTGDNDGILEPGETADLIITLGNSGSAEAVNVSGNLSEDDSFVTLDDNTGAFGNILPAGGTANNAADVFVVSVDPFCQSGSEIGFNLDLSGDLGYNRIVNFSIIIGGVSIIYEDDFSTNRGWDQLGGGGEWTIAAAAGGFGDDDVGGPDPATDHTDTGDNLVLGNDLTPGTGGDYSDIMPTTYWTYSPVIDCSEYSGITLTFYRWLGVEDSQYDQAYLDGFDGTDWINIFAGGETIDDGTWLEMNYDISSIADYNADFQLRFGLGPTNDINNYCGWNIDDIVIAGFYMGGFCGDVNGDEDMNILDVIYLINFKYKAGPAPEPMNIGDVNHDYSIDILDIVYLINFLYKSGPVPDCP